MFLFLLSVLALCCLCWSSNQPFNFFSSVVLCFLSSAWHLASLCMVLESHSLYSHSLLLFTHCSAVFQCLCFFLPQTSWLVPFFLLLLWILFLSAHASLFDFFFLPDILSLLLGLFYALSSSSSALFYMLCLWICGSFFLFALFHFLCRAVVQSAEVQFHRPQEPVHHGEVADSCLRHLPHPDPTSHTPL